MEERNFLDEDDFDLARFPHWKEDVCMCFAIKKEGARPSTMMDEWIDGLID
jgi:hypothetical protein